MLTQQEIERKYKEAVQRAGKYLALYETNRDTTRFQCAFARACAYGDVLDYDSDTVTAAVYAEANKI